MKFTEEKSELINPRTSRNTSQKIEAKNNFYCIKNPAKSGVFVYFKACSKSANKSSMSSIPTLKRSNDSTTPALSRSSFGIEA